MKVPSTLLFLLPSLLPRLVSAQSSAPPALASSIIITQTLFTVCNCPQVPGTTVRRLRGEGLELCVAD